MADDTRKLKVRVSSSGDTAFVNTTDVRQDFTKIYKEVLPKYSKIIVERSGVPVAVISSPEADDEINFETF